MEQFTDIVVPRFYKPWPHQIESWQRKMSGQYDIYFKLWSRQTGKDTSDLEEGMGDSWSNPGIQTAYVGLDNVWISNNIFKKVVDGRKFWADYPEDLIEPKDTAKEVYFKNNPPDVAESRMKFIGFLNDQQLIGSSYDRFIISEASLYKRNAFLYVQPIWDQKIAQGKKILISVNGTPRGIKNNLYDMLKTYTGCDEPEAFPGAHGRVYVDYKPITSIMVPDGEGGFRKMYSEQELEKLKDRYIRQFGNLNLFNQEFMCDFTTVNAGLVYLGIEQLMNEKRFRPFNLDTSKPVYLAFDIASKGKSSDATACIAFQYINNMMFIFDYFETRGKALVEVVAELSMKPWFPYVRFAALPWDSERSASSETPIEEARKMFPQINWHALDKERVDRGIDLVRRQLPNMLINSDNCDYLIEAFNNYEYKWIDSLQDWSPSPTHNRYSHIMDALRYAVMALREISYLRLNADGSDPDLPDFYDGMNGRELHWWEKPNTFRKVPKNVDGAGYRGFE